MNIVFDNLDGNYKYTESCSGDKSSMVEVPLNTRSFSNGKRFSCREKLIDLDLDSSATIMRMEDKVILSQ